MKTNKQALIKALKKKRESEGLSLRALSQRIGISFSSLARIERGEGEPDNNSTIRIVEWLGSDAGEAGLSFENVALVHFRASKNVRSKTVHCLLQAAEELKRRSQTSGLSSSVGSSAADNELAPPVALSKSEMEGMASELRADLHLAPDVPLDALAIRIDGVDVHVVSDVTGLGSDCAGFLLGQGSREWSAMSVPLDIAEDRWSILRNDSHTPERQKVTYLEECWHILLGHRLTRIAKVADAYGRTYDSSEEHDAFYLASATLLPENEVRSAVTAGKSAEEIADLFGTSAELAEYRIKRLGLWRIYKNRSVGLSE
jgi:transcriptional regulator with XRE-family HTH domain